MTNDIYYQLKNKKSNPNILSVREDYDIARLAFRVALYCECNVCKKRFIVNNYDLRQNYKWCDNCKAEFIWE